MSEHRTLLAETAERVFAGLKEDFVANWRSIEEAGLQWVMVGEDAGGFGGGFEDGCIVLQAAGRHAAALPIAEAVIAARLLSQAKLGAAGSLSLAKKYDGRSRRDGGEIVFSGTLRGVAFGRDVERIIALLDGKIAVFLRADAKQIEHRTNPAGEPRDDLHFENAKAVCAATDWNADRLYRVMALAYACQMSGAMDAALALAANHVRDRQQFGKALASFQAIQQQMALFAEEAAATRAACAAAARAADRGDASFEMGCAKLRANQAASIATSAAHQVHGAIGFTREYDLQRFTRRLWAWRSEYGNDRHWSLEIGARAARAGSEGFWPGLVRGFAH
ncbi:MAG TPA: acyl-CoA dehydrogenase family protein [Rhizomicrobium sp.]|nr:acyl-CoA dehydrogenase family protein [Rhizomicrobium sp.]